MAVGSRSFACRRRHDDWDTARRQFVPAQWCPYRFGQVYDASDKCKRRKGIKSPPSRRSPLIVLRAFMKLHPLSLRCAYEQANCCCCCGGISATRRKSHSSNEGSSHLRSFPTPSLPAVKMEIAELLKCGVGLRHARILKAIGARYSHSAESVAARPRIVLVSPSPVSRSGRLPVATRSILPNRATLQHRRRGLRYYASRTPGDHLRPRSLRPVHLRGERRVSPLVRRN